MKKLLFLSFAILFAMASMAQNRAVLIEEHFNGSTMPSGWSIAGLGTSNWSVVTTNNAGGTPNELMLNWQPQFNGTSRLVTPAVDLIGVDSVVFSFGHALNNYQGSHTLGIATSSDDGVTWNVGWSQNYGTSNVWSVNQIIKTPDMGKANVKFCIYYTGNAYNINNWWFDDIKIYVLENLDLSISKINVPNLIQSGNVEMTFDVANTGLTTVTTVEASYEVNGMEPVTEVFNVNLSTFGTAILIFNTPTMLTPGEYDVVFNILKVNGVDDDVAENNTMSKSIKVNMTYVDRIPMIEHFSSSTCGPCVSVNNQMNTFCNNNAGRFTYTKYQMNWPGNGDPYYTAEGGTRRQYYGVNAVPDVFLDGEETNVTQNIFNAEASLPAFMDVRGSFSVTGNTINVKVDIMPYVETQARVFVSVNEKVTHNNVGSNGETSFHHVFMKMLSDVQGTNLNFVPTELQHLEFTQDMSSTHVEEMSDLEVSIWVQNYSSKEIYNSHFAYEYTNEHPYAVNNLTLTRADNYALTASWDAPENGNPIGYDVYVFDELVAENIQETSYSYSTTDSYSVVGVVAKYADDKTSVMSAIEIYTEDNQDHGLVPDVANVVLNSENPSAELRVINANNDTQAAIVINSIEEVNAAGIQYLSINAENLPFTLNYAEDFAFSIEPNVAEDVKSVAQTTISVSSDAGVVEFFIEIDGELLHVTELSAVTKLYPNPATGNFVVEGANVAGVVVYNLVGQKVYEQHDQKLVNINITDWNKGMYLVSVAHLDGTVETMKLMVK